MYAQSVFGLVKQTRFEQARQKRFLVARKAAGKRHFQRVHAAEVAVRSVYGHEAQQANMGQDAAVSELAADLLDFGMLEVSGAKTKISVHNGYFF